MADETKVLALCMDMGRALLENGGEIYRVQETMERVAAAYGAADVQVYVLTNELFASAGGVVRTMEMRQVRCGATHLGRVTALNALSRDIVAGKVPLEEAVKRLEEARNLPFVGKPQRLLACAVGTAGFSILFGGTVLDGAAAFVAGLALQGFSFYLETHPVSKLIYNILSAALVALCSAALTQVLLAYGLAPQLDKIIIGGIIPLVPGVALTSSIRDFAGGDYLSGTIRMIDALLVAASIAAGVGGVLMFLAWLPGVSV